MTGLYLPPECLCSSARIKQIRHHCGGSTSRTEEIYVGHPTAKRHRHQINSSTSQNTTVLQFLSNLKLKRRILNIRCHANENAGRFVGFKPKNVNPLKYSWETCAKRVAGRMRLASRFCAAHECILPSLKVWRMLSKNFLKNCLLNIPCNILIDFTRYLSNDVEKCAICMSPRSINTN
jgi:hypothetical protein